MSPIALEKEDHSRDAEFNKAMHGKSAKARGGMTAMLQKDKAAQQAAVDEYFKHWDNKAAGDETEETRKVCICGISTAYTIDTNKLRNDETNTPPSQGTTTTSQPTCTSTAGDSLSTSPATPMASLSTRPLLATSTTLPTR